MTTKGSPCPHSAGSGKLLHSAVVVLVAVVLVAVAVVVVVVVAMHESHPNGHIVCSAGNAAHCAAVISVHSGILSWVRSSA